MNGIVFWKTGQLDKLKDFYVGTLDCEIWVEQEDCVIFRQGNLLVGFCQRDTAETDGLITFFYDTPEAVDRMYDRLRETAVGRPERREKYRIYNFFAADPEGRPLEFQCFEHRIDKFLGGDQLLLTRRSVRRFTGETVPDNIMERIIDISRFAPTSRNSQSYYFKIIDDRETLERLAGTRGKSSAPIGRAPLAVAIAADPAVSKRHVQDGCIGAYHFILAAWYYGLGTCWIAAMDRDDVKEWLDIPNEHYIATVTPVGYPAEWPMAAPERKDLEWYRR